MVVFITCRKRILELCIRIYEKSIKCDWLLVLPPETRTVTSKILKTICWYKDLSIWASQFFVKGDALSLKSWECENYREILFTPLDYGDLFIRCEIAGHAAPRCQAPAGRHPGLQLRRGRGSQVNKQWSGQLRLLRGECYLFRHVNYIWRCYYVHFLRVI